MSVGTYSGCVERVFDECEEYVFLELPKSWSLDYSILSMATAPENSARQCRVSMVQGKEIHTYRYLC